MFSASAREPRICSFGRGIVPWAVVGEGAALVLIWVVNHGKQDRSAGAGHVVAASQLGATARLTLNAVKPGSEAPEKLVEGGRQP